MIYINQSVLIELDTKIDITTASNYYIKYRKPDGTTGQWTATRSGTKVIYTTDNNDLNVAGTWRIQSYVIISALDKYGKEVNLKINTL